MAARPETQAKIDRVKQLVNEGKTKAEAFRETGLVPSQYYLHVTKQGKPKPARSKAPITSTPTYERIEVQAEKPAMLVVGSPDQIADVMRKFHG